VGKPSFSHGNFTFISVCPEELTTDVHIHHFVRGNEGKLVECVQKMSPEGELWVCGNDDATGIAAGLVAEEARFTIHSVLFKDKSEKTVEQCESWIHHPSES
jgi:hypothetical protein